MGSLNMIRFESNGVGHENERIRAFAPHRVAPNASTQVSSSIDRSREELTPKNLIKQLKKFFCIKVIYSMVYECKFIKDTI